MTALDIIVVLLLGYGIFTGWRRGATRALLSLGVWVVVIAAVWLLEGPISRLLTPVLGGGATIFAFAVIVVLSWLGAKLAIRSIAKGIRSRRIIGTADRVLGAAVGAFKGLIFATLFYMAFSFLYDMIWGRDGRRPQWIESAFTYPLVDSVANVFGQGHVTEPRPPAPRAPAARPKAGQR